MTFAQNANAGGVRRWIKMPETGIVTFGNAPTDAAAEHIQVRPSEGFTECGDHCQSQAVAIDLRDLTEKYRRDPACKRLGRHYLGDSVGVALGQAAKQECAEAKARAELGLPTPVAMRKHNRKHTSTARVPAASAKATVRCTATSSGKTVRPPTEIPTPSRT